MRHFLRLARLTGAVGGLPPRVQQTPLPTALIPTACLMAIPATRLPAATSRAVALTAIAPRAHVRRALAAITNEAPTVGPQSRTSRAWTPTAKPAKITSPGALAPGSEARDGVCRDATVPRAFSGAILYPLQGKRARSARGDDAAAALLARAYTARIARVLTAANTAPRGRSNILVATTRRSRR